MSLGLVLGVGVIFWCLWKGAALPLAAVWFIVPGLLVLAALLLFVAWGLVFAALFESQPLRPPG